MPEVAPYRKDDALGLTESRWSFSSPYRQERYGHGPTPVFARPFSASSPAMTMLNDADACTRYRQCAPCWRQGHRPAARPARGRLAEGPDENVELVDMRGATDRHDSMSPQMIILDMVSSVKAMDRYGSNKQGTASVLRLYLLPSAIPVDQFGDLESMFPGPGNVHSETDGEHVLAGGDALWKGRCGSYFRGDAAFALIRRYTNISTADGFLRFIRRRNR